MTQYSYKGTDGSAAVDFSLFERPAVTRPHYSGTTGRERVERRTGTPGRQLEIGRPMRKSRTATRRKVRSRSDIGVSELAAVRPYIKIIAVVAFTLVAVAILLSSRAELTRLSGDIETAQRQLTSLEQEHEALTFRYDAIMGSSSVEKYVTGELNMVKRQSSDTEYVTIGSGDAFEIAPRRSPWFGSSEVGE